MAFKFNFTYSDAGHVNEECDVTEDCVDNIYKKEAKPIYPEFALDVKILKDDIHELNIGSFKLKHLPVTAAIKHLKEYGDQWENIKVAEDSHSDLVPGVYEGGLKIWECSLDLAKYLYEEKCISPASSVLEIGCGAGLPGVIALLAGANVTFQDYNEEVLNSVTVANIILNTSEADRSDIYQRSHFIAGDWENVQKEYYGQDSSNKTLHDIILTAETIYSQQNHRKLLNLMKCALKPTGTIYLAAKSYYFGVGGGIADFVALISSDGAFDVHELVNISQGVGRQLLRLQFKT